MLFLGIRLFLVIKFVQSANILGIGTIPSISHQIVFHPIWRELSLRGHKVTVVTPDPLNDPKLINLTEISIRHAYNVWTNLDVVEIASKNLNKFKYISQVRDFLHHLTEDEFSNLEFKRLMEDETKTFDVILIEAVHSAWHALSYKYNAPVIGLSSLSFFGAHSDFVGNPAHPVLNPHFDLNFQGDLTLSQRIESSLYALSLRLYHRYVFLPQAQKLAIKYFGKDIPDLGELERNISLWFVNENPVIEAIRSDVPAIVQLLGQTHIKPNGTLPKDLQNILDRAEHGAVYFSLGTNIKITSRSEKLKTIILEALSELPYTVLLKWESENFTAKSDNIFRSKWFPQQDVLAHPKVKVFVTQGGLQSIAEAMSRGVPMVGIPFMGDQPFNIEKITRLGLGIGLEFDTLTKEELKRTIIEVAENSQYRDKIREIQGIMDDQPMTGLEKAIWWTEYVIRHKGARHLRSTAVDTPWYIYYLLDVVAVILGSVYAFYFISKIVLRFLYRQYLQKKFKVN